MPEKQAQRHVRLYDRESGLASPHAYYDESWAVIIGINDYKNGHAPLANARNDAEAFSVLLKKKLGFKEENIFTLLDDGAKYEVIRRWLKDELRLKTQSNDRVIFFFAGHGTTDAKKLGYIVPYDAVDGMYYRNLDMDELCRACRVIPAKHILFILDCCFSGVAAIAIRGRPQSPVVDDAYVKTATTKIAWQILTAGASDEIVADSGVRPGHSAFMTALLDGLNGEADQNGDYVITACELGTYVRARVSRETSQGGRSGQTPFFNYLSGSQEGDFIFFLPNLSKEEDGSGLGRLIVELRDYNPATRRDAARKIGAMKESRAMSSLIQALEDEDPDVRGDVAEALGRIEDVKAVDPLILKLKDQDCYVRRRVAEALGVIGDSKAAGPLRNVMCNDSESTVQRSATVALEKVTKNVI